MNFRKLKIPKNINSILQVTNDIINKNNNYHDYIIKNNNSLYARQLPLLIKSKRVNALVQKKLDDSQKNKDEETIEKQTSMLKKYLSPLSTIRNIKIKSKKLPPLCPLYNNQGELIPSVISSSKIIFKKIDYNNFMNRANLGFGIERNISQPILRKKDLRKIKYNKSCEFDLKIKLDDFDNNYFRKPEYGNTTYDENKIFGADNIANYEDIIKNKIIELQTVHNKNDTIQKQKEYNYGLDKRKVELTLDSLKIKIYEIKDEDAPIIEKKSDKPYFEYTLPFALLPLFYFKGIDSFLIILTKIINFKENNFQFEIERKSNEMISKILKNCNDFFINDNNNNDMNGEEEYNSNEINKNDTEINPEIRNYTKLNTYIQRKNTNIIENAIINTEIKSNLNNPIINTQTNPINNTTEINNNSTADQNSLNYLNSNININSSTNNNNNTNNINENTTPTNEAPKPSINLIGKKTIINTYDIFSSKKNENESRIISKYEYFWITPVKSFLLTIETPLISIFSPSNNNCIKQYIHFELLFYIYKNNFIMWDFYIIKYLSTFKNFRSYFEQLFSVPKKLNFTSFLTKPKIRKILSTNFELASIITRPLSEKHKRNDMTLNENEFNERNNQLDSPKIMRKFKTSKTKNYTFVNYKTLGNLSKNIINENKNNRYSKQIETKISDNNFDKSSEKQSPSDSNTSDNKNKRTQINFNLNKYNSDNKNDNSNNKENKNLKTYNCIFIQKGLLFIASLMNDERETINEFTFHFTVDELRKFQIMEAMQDKMTYFLKFMNVNYDKETITFDFNSFKDFNEINWIKEINKYNSNYLSQHEAISEEAFLDENGQDTRMIRIFKGLKKNIQIKVEMKCPLIIMQDLDNFGFKINEKVNVDYKVEKVLSNLNIHNTLDLTKQLIEILKDNNFCRSFDTTNRIFRKKTTKKRLGLVKENSKTLKKSSNLSGTISDSKEN